MPKKITIVALLSGLAIICISYMKVALELEDAEQSFYSQWWRLTYDDQPPLYTWLQILVNKVFGISKFSFSFLRALLFGSTIVSLYFFGKQYLKSNDKATLSVVLLALLPVFIDFTFRRLSHTTLLCFAVLLSFIVVQRLTLIKTSFNYLLLGFVISLGILTKYNYFLMLAAFLLVIPFNVTLKEIVFNKRIIITIGVIVILIFPHFYDLLSNTYFVEELHKSVAYKTNSDTKNSFFILSSVGAFIKGIFNLLGLLLVFFGILFWRKKIKINKVQNNWLVHMFVSQLFVLFIIFLCMNITNVHTRWLLPLFIPYIILVVSAVSIKNIEQYIHYGFYLFLAIIFLQTIRTPVEKILKIPSSVHYSFMPISNALNTKFTKKQWVLPNVTYAGNIRFLNPDKKVLALDDFTMPKGIEKKGTRVLVHINKDTIDAKRDKAVYRINNFGKEKEDLSFFLD